MRHARRSQGVVVVLLVFAAIVWCSQAVRKAERDVGNDLTGYLAASRALYDGADPYRLPDRFPYIYPLFLAAVLRPLASLPGRVTSTTWFVLQAAALGFVIHTIASRAAIRRLDGLLVAAAIVAVFGDVLQNEFLNGQVNVMVLALAVAAIQWTERRPHVSAFLLGAAIAIKLTPALFLLFWLVERRYRLMAASVAWAGLLIVSPWLIVHNRLWPMYARYLQEFVLARATSAEPHGRPIFYTVQGFWGWVSGASPGAIAILGVSLLVIAALVVWHQRTRRHDASAVYAAGIPLLTPLSEIHHLTFLIPAAVVSAGALRDRAVAAGAVLFAILIWLGRFHRTGPWYFFAILCVILTACMALRRRDEATH